MKIRKVRIWEKSREKQSRDRTFKKKFPREFTWSKFLSIKIEAINSGWFCVLLSETNGSKTTISIPQDQIESVEIYEVPDDVEPSK